MTHFTIQFENIRNSDIALVGGKNASLGEMLSELSPKGIKIPDGFATTAEAFRTFLKENDLTEKLQKSLKNSILSSSVT
jgi:pyruvate, water dikinase